MAADPIIRLLSTGIVRQSFTEIRDGLEADLRTALEKPQLDAHSAHSFVGNVNNTFSARLDQVCQLIEVLANSLDPNRADEVTFPPRAALVGLTRKGATQGTATLQLVFSAPVAISAGAIVLHPDGNPDNAWLGAETIGIPGAGTYEMEFTSALYGAAATFAAGALVIDAGPPELTSATLATDDDLIRGQDQETMLAFRQRLDAGRQTSALGPLQAVRAEVEAIAGVERAVVIETPGYLEAVVTDAGVAGSVIAGTLFRAKGAGIVTTGDETVLVTDSAGVSHAVGFSRTTDVALYLWADLTGTPSLQAILDAVDEVSTQLRAGDTLDAVALLAAIRDVAGVRKVTRYRVSRVNVAPGAGVIDTTDVLVGPRDRATLDVGNMTLVLTL